MANKSRTRKPGAGSRKRTATTSSKKTRRPAKNEDRIDRIFEDGVEIERAVDEAARRALLLHKKMGVALPIWKNGKVVWIPAEKIRV